MLRRTLLKSMLASVVMPLGTLITTLATSRVHAATWFTSAFEATTPQAVLNALAVHPIPSAGAITIEAPQKAENGAVVQVALDAVAVPMTDHHQPVLDLLAEANPTPLIARFYLSASVYPKLVTRIKLAQSGNLLVLAHADAAHVYAAQRPVIVLEDGCASSEREEPFASSMKLRAKPLAAVGTQPALVELKIIILHPMRTGRAKEASGATLPAHFMQQMQITRNGASVLTVDTGTAIARNPYFTFYLRDAALGDVITVTWQDNLGYQGQGQVTVSAA